MRRASSVAIAMPLVAAVLLVAAPPSRAENNAATRLAKAAPSKSPKPAAKPAAGSDGKATEAGDPRGTRFLDGIVAVVDGEPITLRELKNYGTTAAPFLPPEVRGNYQALLESMIEHKLLKSEFEKNNITAPNSMVDRYIANVLEETHQTRQKLEMDIAQTGLTWNDYYERMREEVQRIQLVNLQIRSRVNVPDEQVREAWENDSKFLDDEKLTVGAIFVPYGDDRARSLELANKVRKEAKSDFADAAKEYSKGPGASEGGNLGDFKRGTMAAHFEKGLEGLGKGDVSEPVEGPGGYYIVKLIGTKASARRPYEEVKDDLYEKLYEQRLQERYAKWVTTDLRRDHRVDILVENLALIAANANAAPSSAPALPTSAGAAATATTPAASAPAATGSASTTSDAHEDAER